MSQPFKVCPKCQQNASLNAQACGRCGHVFRTQFAPPDQTQAFHAPPGKKKAFPWPFLVAGCCGGPFLLISITLLMGSLMNPPPEQVPSPTDSASITSMGKGHIPGEANGWDRRDNDPAYTIAGPHTWAAYNAVNVNDSQEQVFKTIGKPWNCNDAAGEIMNYPYDDGWVQVIIHNGQVIAIGGNGIIINGNGFPPIQAAYARDHGGWVRSIPP